MPISIGMHQSAQHGDRAPGQDVRGILPARLSRADRRAVGVGVRVVALVMPEILLAAERHERNRPGEKSALMVGILEYHVHGMRDRDRD